MSKSITRIVIEKQGHCVLSSELPSPVTYAELTRAFASLSLPRVVTIDTSAAPLALVTIL